MFAKILFGFRPFPPPGCSSAESFDCLSATAVRPFSVTSMHIAYSASGIDTRSSMRGFSACVRTTSRAQSFHVGVNHVAVETRPV